MKVKRDKKCWENKAKASQKMREKETCKRKNLTKDVERLEDEVMKGI